MINPKISIITVVWNNAKTIKDAIDSVLTQTYENIEYIVIDGASTDGTVKIVQSYGDKITKFISEKDKGLWDAMNKGIQNSTGEYFCFLNSDDMFHNENVIKNMVNTLTEKKVDAVYGYIDIVDQLDIDKIIRRYRISKMTKGLFQLGMMPAHPGFLCSKKLYEKLGGFLLDKDIAADFELMLRYLVKGNMKSELYPHVIVKMRNGGVSNSSLIDRILRVTTLVKSCKLNNVYTNSFIVLLKYPYKILEYFRKD